MCFWVNIHKNKLYRLDKIQHQQPAREICMELYVSIASTSYFGFFFLPSMASVIQGSSPKPLHICIALQSILEMFLIVCDMSITRTDARPEPWGQAQLIPESVLQQRKWCIQESSWTMPVKFVIWRLRSRKQEEASGMWPLEI